MIPRIELEGRVREALGRSPVVALLGPRQCGKTTLARQFLSPAHPNYFDLEDPRSVARLSEPMTALESLEGLVVLDEIQHKPELFRILRVLVDRIEPKTQTTVLRVQTASNSENPKKMANCSNKIGMHSK